MTLISGRGFDLMQFPSHKYLANASCSLQSAQKLLKHPEKIGKLHQSRRIECLDRI